MKSRPAVGKQLSRQLEALLHRFERRPLDLAPGANGGVLAGSVVEVLAAFDPFVCGQRAKESRDQQPTDALGPLGCVAAALGVRQCPIPGLFRLSERPADTVDPADQDPGLREAAVIT